MIDDLSVSPRNRIDLWNVLQPYTKNMDIVYCPDRTDTGCGYGMDAGVTQSARCVGAGYNWGPIQYSGGGLVSNAQAVGNVNLYVGVTLAAIVAPADTFSLGDSQDTPFYTCRNPGIVSRATGGSNSSLLHGGRFNMAYADGHAKSMAWKAGTDALFGEIAAPANASDWTKWRFDPNATVTAQSVGAQTCGQTMAALAALGVQWYAN